MVFSLMIDTRSEFVPIYTNTNKHKHTLSQKFQNILFCINDNLRLLYYGVTVRMYSVLVV